MSYVIGLPGTAPRLILSTLLDDALLQLRPDEVIFEAEVPRGRWIIAADGESVVAVEPPLAVVKRERWLEARAYRDQRAGAGCLTPAGRVDSDPDSRAKITGGSTAAIASRAAGLAFSVDWTMADNAVITLDADAMIAVGLAVMQHVSACQAIGTAIRARIDAASTTAEVAGIDITEGYGDVE